MKSDGNWVDTAGAVWFVVMILLAGGVLGRFAWNEVQRRPLRSVTPQECVEFWNAGPPTSLTETTRAYVTAAGPTDIDEASCSVSWETTSGDLQGYWALKGWLIDSTNGTGEGWDGPLRPDSLNGSEAITLDNSRLQLVGVAS